MSIARLLLSPSIGSASSSGSSRSIDSEDNHGSISGAGNPGNPGCDVVILFPALGFPALVDNTNKKLYSILIVKDTLVVKDNQGAGNTLNRDELGKRLKYYTWSERDKQSVPMKITINESIEVSPTQDGIITIRDMGLKLHISSSVLDAYRNKGLNTLLCVTINLPFNIQNGMYNLVAPGEDELVINLIKGFSRPYDKCPLIVPDNGTKTISGSDIRVYHPFCVTDKSHLNIAHLTDTHIALRWDSMRQRIINSSFPRLNDIFNNPNKNFENSLQAINNTDNIDILILTGDIIDYNRGHGGVDSAHNIDIDYLYNRNWIRFYELLLSKYEKPIFTVAGNHDWRLNPYASIIALGWGNIGVVFLLLPIIVGIGVGVGLCGGLFFEKCEKKDEPNSILLTIIFILLGFFGVGSLIGGISGLSLGSCISSGGASKVAAKYGAIVGVVLGFIIGGITLLILGLTKEKGARKGILYGTIVGGVLWGILFSASLFLMGFHWRILKYLPGISNLSEQEIENIFPGDTEQDEPNLFGKDGLFEVTEDAMKWYSLVINPFYDYAFLYRDMNFVMLDWNKDEDLVGDPPLADNSLSEIQWEIIEWWRRNTDGQQKVSVLSMHAPIFSPEDEIKIADLKDGIEYRSNDLCRGIIGEQRNNLIKLIRNADRDSILLLFLTGHTHVNDVFQFDGDRLKKYDPPSGFNKTKPLIITTVSTGVIGDGDKKERSGYREREKPGYTQITFTSGGEVNSIEPINVSNAPTVRPYSELES